MLVFKKLSKNIYFKHMQLVQALTLEYSWSKGISEMKLKQQSPCSNCTHRPVMSHAIACTSQAYACINCMLCCMTSQADACSYCMGSVVLISSWICLYLQTEG